MGHPSRLRHRLGRALTGAQQDDARPWLEERLDGFQPAPRFLAELGTVLRRVQCPVATRRPFLGGLFGVATTPAWLAVHGFSATGLCPSCGAVADAAHALDVCGTDHRPSDAWATAVRRVFAAPPAVAPVSNGEGIVCFDRGREASWPRLWFRPEDGPLFVDGWALRARRASITVAAASVVQGDPLAGFKHCSVLGPADFPPAAPTAEHLAVSIAKRAFLHSLHVTTP
jgi:hypothetical protein